MTGLSAAYTVSSSPTLVLPVPFIFLILARVVMVSTLS